MTLEQAIIKLFGPAISALTIMPTEITVQNAAKYAYLNRFWLMRAMAGETVK